MTLRFLATVTERMLVGFTGIGTSRSCKLRGGEVLNPIFDLRHLEYLWSTRLVVRRARKAKNGDMRVMESIQKWKPWREMSSSKRRPWKEKRGTDISWEGTIIYRPGWGKGEIKRLGERMAEVGPK